MTPKTKIYVYGSISVVVLGVLIYIFTKPSKNEYASGSTNPDSSVKNKNANDNFPLKLGSKGAKVTNVNLALGLQPSDEFTNKTEAALKEKFNGATQITKSQYDFFYEQLKSQL